MAGKYVLYPVAQHERNVIGANVSSVLEAAPPAAIPGPSPTPARTIMPVLLGISLCHMLNDMMQVLLPAIYPLLKGGFHLDFAQIGLITLVYQVTGSLLQPLIGLYTDAKPVPFSLPVGMTITMTGIIGLALATSYLELLFGAALLGVGSAIFHPESSRIARAAAGSRFGFAQSIFQVGGNFGQSLGPLLAAFFILPRGRESMAWFAIAALVGISILSALSVWSRRHGRAKPRARVVVENRLPPAAVRLTIILLITLMVSKFVYLASFNSYYIFYLIHRFPPSDHRSERRRVSDGHHDVAGDHHHEDPRQQLVDEGGTGSPAHRERPEPLEDDPGPEHDHDRGADEDGVELLAGVELVRAVGGDGTSAEGAEPAQLVAAPAVEAADVVAKARAPRTGEADAERHGKRDACPDVDLRDEGSAADDALDRGEVERERRRDENPEQKGVRPVRQPLDGVEARERDRADRASLRGWSCAGWAPTKGVGPAHSIGASLRPFDAPTQAFTA